MIEIDPVTNAALEVACSEYLAGIELHRAAEARGLINLTITAGAIWNPPPGGDWDALRDAYFAIADRADEMAGAAPSVADELALRRAAAALRQAGRLIVPTRPTQRIPVVTDAEALERLRSGYHCDPADSKVEIDSMPIAPIDDEESKPIHAFDLGGES